MAKPNDHPGRSAPRHGPGRLFVMATPIGNLGDLSPRAALVLREVAVVAAEDTRETAKLLRHVGSEARLLSAHAHSPASRLEEILSHLASGRDVAVTTDAGTPGVSDPGPVLVSLARERGFEVVPIPGPSAVHAALSASGFPGDRYVFAGFPPRRGSERTRWLETVRASDATVVCFEAPGRVGRLLEDLAAVCGPSRLAVLGRELTKAFEEIRAGSLGELAAAVGAEELRGECTLVLEAGPPPTITGDADLGARLASALRAAGVEGSRAAKVIEQVAGLSRNESYRLAVREVE